MNVRDRVLFTALVVLLALAMIGAVTVARFAARIDEMRREIRRLEVENVELKTAANTDVQTGGAEVYPSEPAVERGTVFPVHPDDFLMYTSAHGLRTSPFLGIEMQHNGVDIAAVWRAQVVAIADGVVVEHWPPPGTPYPGGGRYHGHPVYGGMVLIDHGDMQSLYAHLETTRIRTGQRVRAGEVIGRVGDTGMARGRHLHLELHINGRAVNPLHYVPDPRSEQ